MSKRLLRVFPAQIPNSLPALTSLEIHVVLFDGNTFFGKLKSSSSHQLVLIDLRGHSHAIALSGVQEILYDQVSG